MMLFEKVLSRIASYATHSDSKPDHSVKPEEDSDDSTFSDDDESFEEKPRVTHESLTSSSASSTGKKRARSPEDDSNPVKEEENSSSNESPTKRVKLEAKMISIVPPCGSSSRPAKKEVRFHPDTLDNWRWADRDLHALRASARSYSPPSSSSSQTLLGPPPLPSIPSPASAAQPPLVATPNPKPLTSSNLLAFLDSDKEISGPFGAVLPSSRETISYEDAPEYATIRALRDIGSRTPSLCGEIDPPSRSPSPDSRRQSWGGLRDGVWEEFDEVDDFDMTLKGAPTPLSSPTLPSHRVDFGPSSPSAAASSSNSSISSSAAMTASEIASIQAQFRKLDSSTQALVDKFVQYRCQDAWRAGFQVGIHTQLRACALAAASEGKGQAALLRDLSNTNVEESVEEAELQAAPATKLSKEDLSSIDKHILKTGRAVDENKESRKWRVIGKEEILKNQRGWAAIDAARLAEVRRRGRGVAPVTVPRKTKLVSSSPVTVAAPLTDLEGFDEDEEVPPPTLSRAASRAMFAGLQ